MRDLTEIMDRSAAPADADQNADDNAGGEAQTRDDRGQFAARRDEGAEHQEAPPADDDGQADAEADAGTAPEERSGTVPHGALHAAKAKARIAEEKAAELQKRLDDLTRQQAAPPVQHQPLQPPAPPAQPPEIWDNPDEYLNHRLQPLAGEISEMKEFVSETLAIQTHGEEAVSAAKTALETLAKSGNPEFEGVYRRLVASRHPMDELVKWHKKAATLQKIGDDPDAYIEAEIARRLAAQQQQTEQDDDAEEGTAPRSRQQQPPAARQPAALPNSFAAARSSGGRGAPAFSGPKPLSQIMPR